MVGFIVQGLICGGSDGSFGVSIADGISNCISKSNLVKFWEVILCLVLERRRGSDYDRTE